MVATDVYDSRWVPVLVSAIEIPTFYVNTHFGCVIEAFSSSISSTCNK